MEPDYLWGGIARTIPAEQWDFRTPDMHFKYVLRCLRNLMVSA
jgi:hypothetical protein